MSNVGRKSKINKDVVKIYLACRAQFFNVEESAQVAEVSKQTIYNWQKRGKLAEQQIEMELALNEDYDPKTHHDYDFYKFYLADQAGHKKKVFLGRKNLWNLAHDRYMTDKDGVYKIDKAGSTAAQLAWLKAFDEEFKESKEETSTMHQTVIYNNIDNDIKDDILKRMSAAQKIQVDNVINNKEAKENENENEED